jgi:hypothetical protein
MITCLRYVAILLALSFLPAGTADAQWVYLGRKALGKVQQFTSERKDGRQPGFDVATVLIEARADKVYGKAMAILQQNKDLQITKKDEKARSVEFNNGKLRAGLQANALEENLCQLVVVSNGDSGQGDGTSVVLNSILRICKEMGVPCQAAEPE